MSKLARALTLTAMLAAMQLAGMTAIAQAHPTDPPSRQADATVRRLLARERSSIPNAAHGRLLLDEERSSLLNVPNQTPAEPSGQPGSRIPALGALAAVLALVAGVAMLAVRRAHRSQRASQTA